MGTKAKAVTTSLSLTTAGGAEELAYEINTARLEVAEEYSNFVDDKSFSVHATSMSRTMHVDEVGRFYAMHVNLASAQMGREQMIERTREGIVHARKQGRVPGVKPKLTGQREVGFAATEGKGDHEIWRHPGIDRPLVITQTREVSAAVTHNALKAIEKKRKKEG